MSSTGGQVVRFHWKLPMKVRWAAIGCLRPRHFARITTSPRGSGDVNSETGKASFNMIRRRQKVAASLNDPVKADCVDEISYIGYKQETHP